MKITVNENGHVTLDIDHELNEAQAIVLNTMVNEAVKPYVGREATKEVLALIHQDVRKAYVKFCLRYNFNGMTMH